MASIKIKFRESSVKKKGSCFIQVINKRKMKTIATGMKPNKNEWNAFKEHVIISNADVQRTKELPFIQEYLDNVVLVLKDIIIRLMTSQSYMTVAMTVQNYRNLDKTKSFFTLMEGRIENLKKNGQKRTATNYKGTLRIFKESRKDRDISPDGINGALMKEFEL